MIDATHLKGASYGGKPAQKGALPRRIGRTKGGPGSKLPTICDESGRPIITLLSEGQKRDHNGAKSRARHPLRPLRPHLLLSHIKRS